MDLSPNSFDRLHRQWADGQRVKALGPAPSISPVPATTSISKATRPSTTRPSISAARRAITIHLQLRHEQYRLGADAGPESDRQRSTATAYVYLSSTGSNHTGDGIVNQGTINVRGQQWHVSTSIPTISPIRARSTSPMVDTLYIEPSTLPDQCRHHHVAAGTTLTYGQQQHHRAEQYGHQFRRLRYRQHLLVWQLLEYRHDQRHQSASHICMATTRRRCWRLFDNRRHDLHRWHADQYRRRL